MDTWTYVQITGQMIDPMGKPLAKGYSGLGLAKNDPAAQHVPDMGPIPQGKYTIEAPIDSESHGPYALPLNPDPKNEMFGRSAFLIHGDSIPHPGSASEGCIIIPRVAREAIWQSGDHRLEVIGQLVEQDDESVASD